MTESPAQKRIHTSSVLRLGPIRVRGKLYLLNATNEQVEPLLEIRDDRVSVHPEWLRAVWQRVTFEKRGPRGGRYRAKAPSGYYCSNFLLKWKRVPRRR